jgi:hypothetical protein
MTSFHSHSRTVLVSVCIVLAVTVMFTLFMKNSLSASSLPSSPTPSVGIATQTPVPEVICAQWFLLDNNLPPEKRALEDAEYRRCVDARKTGVPNATDVAKKFATFFAGRTPEPTRLDDSIHKRAGAGMIVEYRSPRVPSNFISENYWYAEVGNKRIVVSPVTKWANGDGVELPRPWQGEVWVEVTTLNESSHFTAEEGSFSIPVKAGRAKITDAQGQQLVISAENGMKFYFDVPTRRFVTALGTATPVATPTSKPYP